MAVSNNLTALLNLVTLISSIPLISAGIWLASKPDNECMRWLRWPLIFIGAAFLFLAFAGFLGAYLNKKGLLSIYLVCMLMLILLFMLLLALASIVTRHGSGNYVPGTAFREYRLEGFSSWLKEQVIGDDNWRGIRTCLINSGICNKFGWKLISASQFYASELSPIQSGCCKPPSICGFQYSGPTSWIGSSNAVDADCVIWSNDPGLLCYDCDSCKAGLLGNIAHEWHRVSVLLIITLMFLICAFLVACCAFKNTQLSHGRK